MQVTHWMTFCGVDNWYVAKLKCLLKMLMPYRNLQIDRTGSVLNIIDRIYLSILSIIMKTIIF